MNVPASTRDVPPSPFLPEEGCHVVRRNRLHIRRVDPARIPLLDGHDPEATLARGTVLLEAVTRRLGLKWWIGVGTALGYAREKGFIAGDKDIDVRVGLDFRDEEATRAVAAEVVGEFEAEGFRLIREMHWDRRPMQTAFMDSRNDDVVFDVFYFYTSYTAGTYVNFNNVGSREKPARFIDDLERSHWPGRPDITVYLPSPIEEYNHWRWGPEWRIPKTNAELDRELDLQCIKDLPSEYVVLAYGSFDMFHDGHVHLLERAAALGDRLVVGVVSDELLHRKGKRPAYTQEQRLDIVSALRCVDEVFVQVELDQKESDIERFDASYLVFGDDWAGHPRVERVRGYRGIEIVYLPRTRGVSSTALRKRVYNAELVEPFESMRAYRATLDPAVDYRIRELGSGANVLDVDTALSHPEADKVVLLNDRVSDRSYMFLFDLVCHGQIVVDLNRMEVHKKVEQLREHGVFEREVHWLTQLHGCGFVPELIGTSDDVMVTRYVGEPVRQHNLPADWREQAEDILYHLERKGCRHNDIKCDNLLVLNGQLYLIDFAFATIAGEPIPPSWPDGIGRQHRVDVHQFDDRKAIYEALDSAARDEIDHSIRIA